MKKMFVVLFVLFLFSIACASKKEQAQEKSKRGNFPETPRKLQKLQPFGVDTEVDKFRCGNFFLFGYFDPNEQKETDIYAGRIAYVIEPEPNDPPHANFSGLFLPKNFRVFIDDKKTVPTVQVVDQGGGRVVMLRISWAEWKKSPCLPAPSGGDGLWAW